MNISTNYSNFQNKVNYNNNLQKKAQISSSNQINNNVNFSGLNTLMKPIRHIERTFVKNEKDWFSDFSDYVCSALGYSEKELKSFTKGESKVRLDFLGCLADKYNNVINFCKNGKINKEEDLSIVKELYNRIKKPNGAHIRFVAQSELPIKDIKKCFDTFNDKPKSIAKINAMMTDLFQKKVPNKSKIIMDIVKSPYAEEYVENYPEYKAFIKENLDKENVIKLLDKEVASGKFSPDILEKNQELAECMQVYPKVGALTKEKILPIYSEEGNSMLEEIGIRIRPTAKSLENGDADAIINIYKTTTPKNEDFRFNYLTTNYHNNGHRFQYRENEIEEINQLFKLCDENPDAKAVVKSLQKHNNSLGRAYNYLAVFNECGVANLRNNLRSVNKTIQKNQFKETESVIEKFRNKKESSLDKFATSIRRIFGKNRNDEGYKKIFQDGGEIIPAKSVTFDMLSKELAEKAAVERMENKLAEEVYKKSLDNPVEKAETKKVKRRYILKPFVEKEPSARKLVIINDTDKIIKEKLGSKVYSEQEKVYARRATRMRVKMLPEIFASIKETRAAARAKGTFNRTKTVKNEDAIDLFSRINGKNRKLVNYMLKVRNADGTRKYDVKQIIEELTRINRESLQKQSIATKENPFTRNDEKALYSSALENQIATFGKLHRSRKS